MDAGLNTGGEGQRQPLPARVAPEPVRSPTPRRPTGGVAVASERAAASSISRPGSPARTARSCSPTAARRSSRSSPRAAIRCAAGRPPAPRSRPTPTARSSTSSPRRSRASSSTVSEPTSWRRCTRCSHQPTWSSGPGGPSWQSTRRWRRRRSSAPTRTSPSPPITPFGLEGPWRDKPATEFTLQAWSGAIVGLARGRPDRRSGARRRPDRRVARRRLRRHRHRSRRVDAPARRASSSTCRCSRRWRCASRTTR